MKALLMLLLLLNFGFFAWQHWYGEESADPFSAGRPVGNDTAPRIVLVDEAEPEALAAAGGQPSVQAPPEERPTPPSREGASPPVMTCATLGPFEERDIAEMVQRRLGEAGFRSALRESGGQIRSGFWVYLPPFPSRDAAEATEDELRAKGVHDLFIVSGSDQQNAISLGLFSTPERADQRAAEIGRLGFSPRVAERFRDATVYWVDFLQSPGQTLEPEALGALGAGVTLPEKRSISCDDIAVRAGGA